MSGAREPPEALSLFWGPLCAIGAHGPGGPNAQIGVAVAGASIVPERPRLLLGLWKTNLTHDLVRETGLLAVTVLAETQADLVPPLGLRSGRDGPKLGDLEGRYQLTRHGNPWFPGGLAAFECVVLDALDAGDATFFLVAVSELLASGSGAALRWPEAQRRLGPTFLATWETKAARNRATAAATMRWIGESRRGADRVH